MDHIENDAANNSLQEKMKACNKKIEAILQEMKAWQDETMAC
jgi:hypothetical protein